MPVIAALGMVLALWIVAGAGCLGWGTCLVRPRASEATDVTGTAAVFWTGFAVVVGALQVWHLFLPVDWRATVVFLGGGIVAGYFTGAFRPQWAGRPAGVRAALLLLFAAWLAYRGLDFPRNYDSGLYHFATIRWINEYPVVPGLANLHERLGFNQAYFLWVALLNAHPFFNEGYHAANSLLCFALVAQFLGAAHRISRAGTPAAAADVLSCLLLPVVLAQALGGDISSPTPDLAVFAVGLVCFVQLVQWTEIPEGASRQNSTLTLTVLLVAGCTLKLSFLAFALAVMAVMLHRAWGQSAGKMALLFAVAGLLWGIPYAIHGIVLSGYPAFPSTAFAWPADWRLPVAETQGTARWILSWARTPGAQPEDVLGSWAWLGPWWQRTRALPGVWLPLWFAAASGLALAEAGLFGRGDRGQLVRWLWLGAPLLVGLLSWFFTAPDPRFATWLIWLLAALLGAGVIRQLGSAWTSLPRLLAPVAVIAALGVIALGIPAWVQPRRYGFDSLPRAALQEYTTHSGLKVFLPAPGSDVRLWDAPLPAAPRARPNLELRGPTLREGFRTGRAGPLGPPKR